MSPSNRFSFYFQLKHLYEKQKIPGRFAILNIIYLYNGNSVSSQIHTFTLEVDGRITLYSEILYKLAPDIATMTNSSASPEQNIQFLKNFSKIIIDITDSSSNGEFTSSLMANNNGDTGFSTGNYDVDMSIFSSSESCSPCSSSECNTACNEFSSCGGCSQVPGGCYLCSCGTC